jgi:hypothetical protein
MNLSWDLMPASQLPDFRETWDRLRRAHHDGHALLAPGVTETAVAHFADDSVILAIGRDGSRITAMALLAPTTSGRWSTFYPSQVPYTLFVSEQPLLLSARSLLRELPGFGWEFGLMHMDDAYGHREPALPETVPLEYGTTIAVETRGSFEDYWAGRSRNLRKNVNRYQRRFEREGMSPRLVVLADEAQMHEAVERYGELESRGWKGRSGSAVHGGNEQGRFYTELLERMAAEDAARVYELWIDDTLLASRLTICAGGMLVILKTTYNESYARYAPGQLLLFETLRVLFADPAVEIVEFYTRATAERLQWATVSRTTHHHTVYRYRWIRWCRDGARVIGRAGDAVRARLGSARTTRDEARVT